MTNTVIALTAALQKTTRALNEFRTKTSKSYNPSDIDEICDQAEELLEDTEARESEGLVVVEIGWEEVQRVFPSLSKEDAVEFMTINRSDIVARMKDAALKAIQERGMNS